MEWIKISDQLPPEPEKAYIGNKNYLCTVPNEQVVCMRYVKATVRGKEVLRWEWDGRISPWEVIAWMPMPEPYKQK